MQFGNFSVGTRLATGFGILLVALAGLGWTAMNSLSGSYATLDKTVNKDAVKLEAALDMQVWVRANSRRIFELAVAPDAPTRKHVLERMAANSQNADKAEKRLTNLVASPEGKAKLEAMVRAKAATRASYKKVEDLALAEKTKEALEVVQKETDELINKYNATILEMGKHQREGLEKSVAAAKVDYEKTRNATLGVVAGLILLGILFAWLVTRSITRPVTEARAMLEVIAGGDLSAKIEARGRDEIGQMVEALAKMQQQLVATVGRIRGASEAIGSASGQIAQGNADLSSRTEEQASSLEETASSMEELTSTVKQNAENARQANQLATGASSVAVKGGQVVSQVVDTMNGISGSSRKIADIIGVIDGIAFQTNILALNAAVEAARAGEQGRGFAVVATEVRNLAQRSAAAAKEIKELISDSVGKVEAGSRLVDEAGKTMEEVVSSVKRVTDIMAEITAASQEQSGGIEQVNQAITQMDQVTQQNAALVEEAAAAAESMKEQAQGLIHAVSVFKLNDSVQAAQAAPVHVPSATGSVGRPERRSAQRATNVTRLPAGKAQKAVAASGTARPAQAKVAGSDANQQEWEEF